MRADERMTAVENPVTPSTLRDAIGSVSLAIVGEA